MKLIIMFIICNGFSILLQSDATTNTEIWRTIGIAITSITSVAILIITIKNKNVAVASKVVAIETKDVAIQTKDVAVETKNIALESKDTIVQYHKEVNGHMGELLKTTKELGERIGAEKQKAKNGEEDQAK